MQRILSVRVAHSVLGGTARQPMPWRAVQRAAWEPRSRSCSMGEVAIFEQQLRSRFEWLREPDPAAVASPTAVHGLRPAVPGEP